ncbi:glutaryl-CoA dehydrogenase [Vagococcus penaei]|uniref:Glutaryl-CoA dehydrogenase n=1 Tax=Vagococcus penaei TaxID=633807 RepID=A0A1Q2D6P1_9ENTE|nr:acyl-CoA dehydrogenase family protein [Vagococcus penaei]AQP54007.1 glutaryl-CoA dehydrogenase [Vagococcus penaei]RSU01756.1 glutaryl-CoA dehydrogenase [Vagococcus penaei]
MNKLEKLQELYPEDLLGLSKKLTDGEVEVLYNLRKELEKDIQPVIAEYWDKAEFPTQVYDLYSRVGVMNNPLLFEGREGKETYSEMYNAFLFTELARTDTSIATAYTIHRMAHTVISQGGTEEQKAHYLPKLEKFELTGCFALTEPLNGSDIAKGLKTSARQENGKWILNGEKYWVGAANTADVIPVFARDEADGEIKCFILHHDTPGVSFEVINHKMALRPVQNCKIIMEDATIDESQFLPKIKGFGDVTRVFQGSRVDVGHIATGTAAGSLAATLKYATDRQQFGRPIAKFQLVQEKIARMEIKVAANIALSVILAENQENGDFDTVNASLHKMHNALNLRELVALGREICGGNGINIDYGVGRYFADAEAVYTYEGSHDINALILSRALTGMGAFV